MMCSWVDVLCFADFLVGGQWRSDLEDGLFASSWSATSGLTTTDIGARLLIRDLMCFVPVCSSSYLLVSLLLSAVIGTTLPRLACGIGISITLPLICGLPSVLDLLYGNWCVRAWLSTCTLVGGAYDDSIRSGCACWWCALASSITGGMIGARLLIYREMMCMSAVILPIILSAVDMVLVYRLACGVGLWTILRLMLLSISVLDLLY